ncbi:hypothetical protein L1987_21014 [Smallanthus sonchifolius]|uniref:Uncharacterized protein n=1 Tax=Smallanthus sonchifolius TaxID=185202 RepID=A0ACB9IUW1_9ASTR|nr:hypothetical protein L1987_21014 [Smallanthus sonchifolius]
MNFFLVLKKMKGFWRKVESKSKYNREKSDQGNEGGDQNEKLNIKRKDEENGNESEKPMKMKKTEIKPRVVWTIDLHQKFVAAKINWALRTKRIIDLMNVDGLTKESVANHLQKYKLYLKTLSQHQANMVTASTCMTMSPLDGLWRF